MHSPKLENMHVVFERSSFFTQVTDSFIGNKQDIKKYHISKPQRFLPLVLFHMHLITSLALHIYASLTLIKQISLHKEILYNEAHLLLFGSTG